jgi:CBS domain-containing protein
MGRSEFEDSYEDEESLEIIRGEILGTPIQDLSLRSPITVEATATIADAISAMNDHRTGCVLVVRDRSLAGIFTERDILKKVVFQSVRPSDPVQIVMTPNPETLEPNASIAFALNKMSVGGYRHIPVVERDGKPLGVLSVRDIVDLLVELYPADVLNLPPTPEKGIATTVDGG